MYHLIHVRPEPAGQFTAQAAGIPEARAVAGTREEAIRQVRGLLIDWLASGQLVPVEIPEENPVLRYAGHWKDDPDFQAYLDEIQRYRQEVDERECSNPSSTPTT